MVKKWLLLTVKVAISVALVAWVFKSKNIDLGAAWARVETLDPLMIPPIVAAFVGQYLVSSARWRSVLVAIGARFGRWTALRLLYIGAFFHQTLPASVGGDAVRTFLAYRHGVSLRAAVNGIMLERAVTLTGLILLVAAVQPAFLPRVGPEAGDWMAPLVALAVVAAIAGILVVAMLDRLPERLRRWRVVRGLAYLAADTRALFFSPVKAAPVFGWTLLGHVLLVLAVYFVARGLALGVGLVDCFALFLPVLLLSALPISIAGWGVREGGMVYAFGLIGVPAGSALVLSVLYGLFAFALAMPGGLVWLASGFSRQEIAAELGTTELPPRD